jgi:AraC-like DNA-binding protein
VVLRQQWVPRASYNYSAGRPDSALLWIRSGVFTVHGPDGISLSARPGDLVYFPVSAKYTACFAPDETTADTQIHFHLVDESGEDAVLSGRPVILLSGGGPQWQEFFDRAEREFSAVRGRLRLTACICELLDRLAELSRSRADSVFRVIAPGIALLEAHLEENIPVPKLAQECCVSERTFRRLFCRYAGMSPVQYKNALRIVRAKQLLSGGELTVGEIGEMLGFYDSSCFCRLFRRETGCWPGDYARQCRAPG